MSPPPETPETGTQDRPDIAGHTPGFSPLVIGMDACAALVVLAMVVIVNVDVLGRWLFNRPLPGSVELTEMGVVAAVFLALAHCIAVGRMTRSETLLDATQTSAPRFNLLLRAAFNTCGAAVLLIIAYGQYPRLLDSWQFGYFKGNVGVFTAPRWPLDALLLLGVVAGMLQFLLLAARNIRMFRKL